MSQFSKGPKKFQVVQRGQSARGANASIATTRTRTAATTHRTLANPGGALGRTASSMAGVYHAGRPSRRELRWASRVGAPSWWAVGGPPRAGRKRLEGRPIGP